MTSTFMDNLSKLIVNLYPPSLECYCHLDHDHMERFPQVSPELLDVLMAKMQLKTVALAAVPALSVGGTGSIAGRSGLVSVGSK